MPTYPGGKNGPGVYHTIINQMPPHKVYIEPFLGSGAVLRLKRPAIVNIGIDRDEDVVSYAEYSLAAAGERRRQLTPDGSSTSGNGAAHHRSPEMASSADTARNGDSAGVTILHGDGIRYLQERRWDPTRSGDAGSRTLIYCDPPYLISARLQHRPIYRYEFTERQHIELLGTLKTLPCLVMISGYDSPLYREMLPDWRVVTFETMTRGGTKATEFLWMNYPEPTALHDYRFIGKDFRERERIKRRVQRWRSRLRAMGPHERRAIAAALIECGDARSLNAECSDTISRVDN